MPLVIPNFEQNDRHLATAPEIVTANLFQAQGISFQLVLLEPCTDLLHKLAATKLQNQSLWSALDEIQNVEMADGISRTFYDLDLPTGLRGLEPIFLDNEVIVYRETKIVARVKLRNQIELVQISYFQGDGTVQEDHYDDRGFISFTSWRNATHEVIRKRWYTPRGHIVMEADRSGKITPQPEFQAQFRAPSYRSLAFLIREKYLEKFGEHQTIISALGGSRRQNQIAFNLPAAKNLVLLDDQVVSDDLLNVVQTFPRLHWIFPSQTMARSFAKQIQSADDLQQTSIEPFPASFDLGISNELEAKVIYARISKLTATERTQFVTALLPLLLEDKHKVLVVEASMNDTQLLRHEVDDWIASSLHIDLTKINYEKMVQKLSLKSFETEEQWLDFLDDQVDQLGVQEFSKAQLRQFYQLNQLLMRIHLLDEGNQYLLTDFSRIRLYIDLGALPSLRHGILAITVGVPQIVQGESDLVLEQENGLRCHSIKDLHEQIPYFTDNLFNWNHALVENVKLEEKYSAASLIKQWEQVIGNESS
ncbi:Accessory secretory protein Asp1 [Fructilactobacillus florum 8D]|uniref:Accessory secretory protein Asp1 n=1 Tax=Fructilactobacillus florum 8D TaxID=1221538 RepID=W9EFX3_9LACO|nr:accessory Sec system protein Asp1 [Fructilactobacillus florum]ETO41043.1 Accessory secretory protein Asp1 [Fructilactobacillus florum 8D]